MINNSNFNNNNRQNFQNNNNYNYNKGNMNNNNVGNNKPHNSNMNFNNNKQNMNLNYNNNIIYNNNKNEFNNIKNNINQYNNNKKNNYNNQTNINKNIINNIPNNQKPYNQNKNYPNNNIYNNNSQNNIYYNNNQNNIYNNNNQNNMYNNNNPNNKNYNNHINNNPNNNKSPTNIYNQNQNNINNNHSNNFSPVKLFSNVSYFEDPNKSNREKMEDFHTIIPQLTSNPPTSYFAIFDGHSGDQPARYCKENLHKILLKNLNLTKFNYDKSLHNSFQEIDNEISKKNFPNESGTTATVILIYQKYNNTLKKNEKYITCANVGDSKCYLVKQNSLIKISKDHNCNDKNEVDRIKKNGGMVFSGRVFGSLMLTRSIGDREMKNYGVCSIPSINTFKINYDEVFIIIASDGVWDVVNEESLLNVCKENLNCEELSKKIIQLSLEYDSTDNVSCVVVKL
jgi:protein phosphatase PTC1